MISYSNEACLKPLVPWRGTFGDSENASWKCFIQPGWSTFLSLSTADLPFHFLTTSLLPWGQPCCGCLLCLGSSFPGSVPHLLSLQRCPSLLQGPERSPPPSLSGETEGRPLPLENRRAGVCADAGLAAQGTDVGLGHRRTRKLCQQRLHAHGKPLLASARIQIGELTLSLLWIHQWLK